MALIDTHAHLSLLPERGLSLADFFREWESQGGGEILDIGTEPESLPSRRALIEPCRGNTKVLYSAGAWPSEEVMRDPAASLSQLERAIAGGPALDCDGTDGDSACGIIAALGEVGLEYNHPEAPLEAQKKFFADCAALAETARLPLIVHSRDAFADTLTILKDARLGVPVIIHCFSYSIAEAQAFLDLGCYLSFSGAVTFKKNDSLRLAAAIIPAERLLYETDSPYLCPEPHRGKVNTPNYLPYIVEVLAKARGEAAAAVEAAQAANFQRLFIKD
jgi:TatD DNase family protein